MYIVTEFHKGERVEQRQPKAFNDVEKAKDYIDSKLKPYEDAGFDSDKFEMENPDKIEAYVVLGMDEFIQWNVFKI